MQFHWQKRSLSLLHPWTLSRGSTSVKEYLYVTLEHDGLLGLGEAAHSAYQEESLESTESVFAKAQGAFAHLSPADITQEAIHQLAPRDHAAKAALDMAVMDWSAKRVGQTLTQFLNIPEAPIPPTSFSIAISDDKHILRDKVMQAEPYAILKIKLGSDRDREIVEAVREFTDKPLRVDANEGWATKEQALDMAHWLANCGVEFIEQPLRKGHLTDTAWLRERSPLPIVADEDVRTTADLPILIASGAYDGVNVKLMKTGGIREALALIQAARAAKMSVMLGCMIESSLGIGAASRLAPLVDYVDLDGNLLITNDPFSFLPSNLGIGAIEIHEQS